MGEANFYYITCLKSKYFRHKSTLSCQHTEFNMSDRKAVIKNADMAEDMQQDAVDCATQALEKYNIEKDIAGYIKKEFDKKYNPTWHCIVGRNFGSYVTHETKHFHDASKPSLSLTLQRFIFLKILMLGSRPRTQ